MTIRPPLGKAFITRKAPPKQVGAILLPETAHHVPVLATVNAANVDGIPVGVEALVAVCGPNHLLEGHVTAMPAHFYGWFEDGELVLAPNRVAILAKKDEHENDLIYIPGNFLRFGEAVEKRAQRWVVGTVWKSTHPDLKDGDKVLYYEAAGTVDLAPRDFDMVPEGHLLRLFLNAAYEPIDSVMVKYE
jgi:hypothetical protein